MKRSEFILRLAVENKFAVVSDTVDVIYNPYNTLDPHEKSESSSTSLSMSPSLQSPEQDSTQHNVSIVADDIKEQHSYENIELALSQGNGNYSNASETTEKNLHLTPAKKLMAESFTDKLSTSFNNKFVNIISDVILQPATSEGTNAQYMSDLTSTVPIEYDIYSFNDKEYDDMDIETRNKNPSGCVVSDNKNLTLLAPCTSRQEFIENYPHFGTYRENTDGIDIWPVYNETENEQITILENNLFPEPSTFPLQLDNILPSDGDDEYESSGDEYVPPTDTEDEEDDDSSSSDSGEKEQTSNKVKTFVFHFLNN